MAKKSNKKRRRRAHQAKAGSGGAFSDPVTLRLAHGRGQRILTFVYLMGGGLAVVLAANLVITSVANIGEPVADDTRAAAGETVSAASSIPIAVVFAVLGVVMFRMLYLPAFRSARRRAPAVTLTRSGIEVVDGSILSGRAKVPAQDVSAVTVGQDAALEFAEMASDWKWKPVPDHAQLTPFAQRPNAHFEFEAPVGLSGARGTRTLGARWPVRPPRAGAEYSHLWCTFADPDHAGEVLGRWSRSVGISTE